MKDLTTSQRKVLAAVQSKPESVFKEICDLSGVCPRTVRHCLDALKTYGLIRTKCNLADMRLLVYSSQPK